MLSTGRIETLLLSRKTPGKKRLLFGGTEDETEMEGPSSEDREKGRGPRRNGCCSDRKDGKKQQSTAYEERK